MAALTRLSCDQCQGESLTVTHGDTEQARTDHARDGWQYVPPLVFGGWENEPAADLCPVCAGTNPDYYTAEPF